MRLHDAQVLCECFTWKENGQVRWFADYKEGDPQIAQISADYGWDKKSA